MQLVHTKYMAMLFEDTSLVTCTCTFTISYLVV